MIYILFIKGQLHHCMRWTDAHNNKNTHNSGADHKAKCFQNWSGSNRHHPNVTKEELTVVDTHTPAEADNTQAATSTDGWLLVTASLQWSTLQHFTTFGPTVVTCDHLRTEQEALIGWHLNMLYKTWKAELKGHSPAACMLSFRPLEGSHSYFLHGQVPSTSETNQR